MKRFHGFKRYNKALYLISRRYASIDYLVGSIPKPSLVPTIKPSSKPELKNLPPKDIRKLIITPLQLNDYFRHELYQKPKAQQITQSQAIFSSTKNKHEWSHAKYDEIPDIKYNRLTKLKEDQYKKMDKYKASEYHETFFNSRKTFGIVPEHLKVLPEVLLLGHTNSGKSSLVNTLLLNREENKSVSSETQHAFVSKRAGYTKTLSSYNVGNKVRIIDSPGYGEFGDSKQGEVVMDYIQQRQVLRRAFLLIDSIEGFQEEDLVLIDSLIEEGVPFELIFTKVDEVIRKNFSKLKLKLNGPLSPDQRLKNGELVKFGNERVISHFDRLLEKNRVKDLVTVPKLLFNNGQTNDYIAMRHGYKEIRLAILQSCGIIE